MTTSEMLKSKFFQVASQQCNTSIRSTNLLKRRVLANYMTFLYYIIYVM